MKLTLVIFYRSGGIAVDDEIIAIDDNEIQGLPLESALQLLKTNNHEVRLLIRPVSSRNFPLPGVILYNKTVI